MAVYRASRFVLQCFCPRRSISLRHCGRLGLLILVGALHYAAAAPPGDYTRRITVDQFGYLPELPKVAVISDPQVGYNSAESYTPGGMLEVREWDTDTVVFTGAPAAWQSGATHAQSGDRVRWFDFSPLTRWGEYCIYDPANDTRSARFRVDHRVFEEVLRHATRVFYYQRRGLAKVVPYADPRWADAISFLGPRQDSQCRPVTDPASANLKDLRGGWFDAGDYNKYVNFTVNPVSDLLFAYRHNPLIWPDDWGIPESGNGIPDLLDEVKWELDWLLRMQNADGSLLSKVAVTEWQSASPPSAEDSPIYYGAESTSASLTTAGHFAQAVPIFQAVGLTGYADTLRDAAVAAYDWAIAHPSVVFDNTGFASANPEVDDYERDSLRLRAAVFLYEITGEAAYRTRVESGYRDVHAIDWGWWGPYEMPVQDALLHFTSLPGVAGSVVSAIRNSKSSSINGGDFMGAWTAGTDAYRSHLSDAGYHWGNNQVKAKTGLLFAHQLTYSLNPAQAANYRAAAAGYLHYFHGVNPLSLAYLSNMYESGADDCVNEMYHSWFGDGTLYDNALTSPNGPAPGYVTGGANKNFQPDAAYVGLPLIPPMNQPPQKSYRDWNTSWPENSWELTEPAIYYQGAYVYLLSRFIRPLAYSDWTTGHGLSGEAAVVAADPDEDGMPNGLEYAFDLSPLVADEPGLPAFQLQSHSVNGTNGTYLTVQFKRQLGAANLTYDLQGSPDLLSWTSLFTAAGSDEPVGPGFVSETGTAYQREIVARDIVPVENATGPRFVRLAAIWNE